MDPFFDPADRLEGYDALAAAELRLFGHVLTSRRRYETDTVMLRSFPVGNIFAAHDHDWKPPCP